MKTKLTLPKETLHRLAADTRTGQPNARTGINATQPPTSLTSHWTVTGSGE